MEDKNIIMNNYFNEFNTFANKRFSKKRLKHIIQIGLETFYNLPNVETSYYYQFNEEKLDFDFFASYPENDINIDIIDTLFDTGLLTKALNSTSFVFDSQQNMSVGVAKIDSMDKVHGILILKLNYDAREIKVNQLNFFNMMKHFFNSSINEFIYQENLKRSQDLIDQFVASRTMELEKKKVSSDEKFEMMSLNLLHSIPHEVRTPINQILGLTNFLINHYLTKDFEDYEDIKEILTDILDSGERLKRLFENYVYYSSLVLIANDINKIDELRNQYTESTESTIKEIVKAKVKDSNREKDVIVNIVEAPVAISESYLIKIIQEIIDNALKYSNPGEKIYISSNLEKGFYILQIKDNGIGIESDMLDRIGTYVQFNRDTMEQQGIGLGLAIVQRVLSLHSAILNIESKKDQYTNIIIKIPVASTSKF